MIHVHVVLVRNTKNVVVNKYLHTIQNDELFSEENDLSFFVIENDIEMTMMIESEYK